MKKHFSFLFSLLPVAAALWCLITYPSEAAEGARRGLALCGGTIVPPLLPFFVLSGLISALGLPQLLGKQLEKPMNGLFGAPGLAATPLVLGFLGGYPVGATALADLVKAGALSPEEGSRLLPWCNNTGPAFIIGAVGAGVFGSGTLGLGLYACHILAALLLGLLFSHRRNAISESIPHALPSPSLAGALPGAVKGAAMSTVYICAFVIFFSVITALLEHLGIFGALAGTMATHLGLELRFCRAALCGVLELGSGVGALAGLPPTPCNLALAAFVLGFGSLSVHCQTLAAVDGTQINCARHFVGRMLHGVFSALFSFLLFTLLQI